MNVLAKPRMTVDQYLAWAERNPGRYELHRGEVYAMAAETAAHVEVKAAGYVALRSALRARQIPCHLFADGMTVRVDEHTAYEPDALAYCGEKVPPTSVEVPNPVIVVEVLSPSTGQFDASIKLAGYFRLPSVAHYLIVDPTQPLIVHHSRGSGDMILTRIVTEGALELDPPGLQLAVRDIYST